MNGPNLNALIETRPQGEDRGLPQLTRYQFENLLNSAAIELDDQAQIICYEEYYPFGSTSFQSIHSQIETPKHYRYTGKERDEKTSLYYYGARYYPSWLGRWISPDPAGLKDGPDPYVYVSNRPTIMNDPTGDEGKNVIRSTDPMVFTYGGLVIRAEDERQVLLGNYLNRGLGAEESNFVSGALAFEAHMFSHGWAKRGRLR